MSEEMQWVLGQRKQRLQETPAWRGGRAYESISLDLNRAKSATMFFSPRLANRSRSSAEVASRIREVYSRSSTRISASWIDQSHHPAPVVSGPVEGEKRNRPQTSRPRSIHGERENVEKMRLRPFTAGDPLYNCRQLFLKLLLTGNARKSFSNVNHFLHNRKDNLVPTNIKPMKNKPLFSSLQSTNSMDETNISISSHSYYTLAARILSVKLGFNDLAGDGEDEFEEVKAVLVSLSVDGTLDGASQSHLTRSIQMQNFKSVSIPEHFYEFDLTGDIFKILMSIKLYRKIDPKQGDELGNSQRD
eukprot:768592-Hanusia_phi.AAC.1